MKTEEYTYPLTVDRHLVYFWFGDIMSEIVMNISVQASVLIKISFWRDSDGCMFSVFKN